MWGCLSNIFDKYTPVIKLNEMMFKFEGPLSSMGSTCFYTMPGINSPEPTEFFRILRVVYIQILGYDRTVDLPILFPFTYETFTPEMVRVTQKDLSASSQKERLEKMKETFSKVIAFLRNSGTAIFIRVVCVCVKSVTKIEGQGTCYIGLQIAVIRPTA